MATPQTDDGRLNVRLPKGLLKRFKIECAKRDTTQQAATEAAIREWLRGGKS